MTRVRGARRRTGTWSRGAAALLAVAALMSACTGDDQPSEPNPSPAGMALSIETAPGAGTLGANAQADAETAVGDVLSHYVVAGFLGDYPRENFVGAFDAFTGGAARTAAGNIDLLTANRYGDASEVRATRLDARVSFLVDDRDVVGASAAVSFGFEATTDVGTTPFSLEGRLLLEENDGTWSVFGYDVTRDDPEPIDAESTS